MSLLISIFLAIFALVFSMLGYFFADKKQTSDKKLADLSNFSEVISLYCKIISLLMGIGLVVLVVKNTDSSLKAFLEILIFVLIIYASKSFYHFIRPIGVRVAPYFSRVAKILAPLTYALINLLKKLAFNRSGNLYTKETLIDLIKSLRPEDGLTKNDLELAVRGLNFSSLVVKDFYTPRKMVKFLDAEAEISTVMIDDLYKSGFSRFPVYTHYQDNIVGTLYLKDLIEKKYSGKVSRIMSTEVYEIKENDSLAKALNKFIKTRHHLFVVKNEFGEILGVITVEDVLEQLIGREIMDETDKVADLRLEAIKSVENTEAL